MRRKFPFFQNQIMSTNKQTYWHTIRNHKQTNMQSSCRVHVNKQTNPQYLLTHYKKSQTNKHSKFMSYIRSWKLNSRHLISAMRPQLIWLALLLASVGTCEDESQSEESNTTLDSKELAGLNVEIISGNKKGSQWLIIDKEFICHPVSGRTLHRLSPVWHQMPSTPQPQP